METFFGVLVVIVFFLVILGPMLRRFFAPMLQRWAMHRMEDSFRKMAGMPTRKEERRARKKAARKSGVKENGYAGSRNGHSSAGMLRSVAEDVEFTEIKEFDDGSVEMHTTKVEYRIEEQIEDAEFTELK